MPPLLPYHLYTDGQNLPFQDFEFKKLNEFKAFISNIFRKNK